MAEVFSFAPDPSLQRTCDTTDLHEAHTGATVTTDELRTLLGNPAVAIVDIRPVAAYNGWRLRGGNIRYG